MAVYTVESAAKKADKPDKGYGPMQVISLALKNGDGEVTHAEWYTKATTAIPAAGAQIEGDLTSGQYGWSFKKASMGGGMGPRPEDPKRAAAIARMHAQEMAIRCVDIATRLHLIEPESSAELFKAVASTTDWFERDVEKARDAA